MNTNSRGPSGHGWNCPLASWTMWKGRVENSVWIVQFSPLDNVRTIVFGTEQQDKTMHQVHFSSQLGVTRHCTCPKCVPVGAPLPFDRPMRVNKLCLLHVRLTRPSTFALSPAPPLLHGAIRAVFLPHKHFTFFAALWAAPHTPHTPDE